MRRPATMMIVAVAAVAWLSPPPAMARDEHAHTRARPARPRPAPAAASTAPSRFYPQDIEGGVPGNLPFNNQIRKHTDPLNANGGR